MGDNYEENNMAKQNYVDAIPWFETLFAADKRRVLQTRRQLNEITMYAC